MAIETRHVRYVFADVVEFTQNRSHEAQVDIILGINRAFKSAIADLEVIFLPTGDGVCAGILQSDAPADIHIQVAMKILKSFYEWSNEAAPGRRGTSLRIAVNESIDTVIWDINGKRNLAGNGINMAQRLISSGSIPRRLRRIV